MLKTPKVRKVASIINLIHFTKMRLRQYSPGLYEGHKILPADIMGGGMGSMFGNTYFCIKSDDSRYGQFKADYDMVYPNGNHAVQTDLAALLLLIGPYDTIFLCSGNWSGNYTSPLNAVAPFVSLIGIDPVGRGIGPWMAPSDTGLPIIDVLARGWRIGGIEFEGMTGAAAIRMTKVAGLTSRCDFFKIDHCLFSGGKTGIEFNGGGTYWEISDNHFSLLSTAGGGGIYVSSSGYQIPALGLIKNNRFDNNVNHINGGGTRGFSDTVIQGNNFQLDGNDTNATILMSIKGGGGGNSVIGNYFDIAKAEFNTGGTQRVFSNSTDYAAGNWFKDGAQDVEMRA